MLCMCFVSAKPYTSPHSMTLNTVDVPNSLFSRLFFWNNRTQYTWKVHIFKDCVLLSVHCVDTNLNWCVLHECFSLRWVESESMILLVLLAAVFLFVLWFKICLRCLLKKLRALKLWIHVLLNKSNII